MSNNLQQADGHTDAEQERRAIMVENGLEHYGACVCGVGSRGIEARLYRCHDCGVKVCYRCKQKHVCEGR